MSETNTCRQYLAKWCVGNGADIGFGGFEPIVPSAICMDRAEGDHRRPPVPPQWPTHWAGDVFERLPFSDCSLDWVYSSHVLEDAIDPWKVAREWLRVIKVGGLMVLLLPDQKAYLSHCSIQKALPNMAHVFADFSLSFVKSVLGAVGDTEIVHEAWPLSYNAYSFELVVRKTTHRLKLTHQEMAAANAAMLLQRCHGEVVKSDAVLATQVEMFLKNNLTLFRIDEMQEQTEATEGEKKV